MSVNILLVDDSSVMRSIIRKIIHLSGVTTGEIREAVDGRQGLLILKNKPVDLVFIDINMPVMDGVEMLEFMRKKPETRKLPVLIVSTGGNEGRIREMNLENVAFVQKPFTPETLKGKIISMLASAGKR